MITPFTEYGIDFERLGALLDFQAQNGTAAVVIAGTTGEISTLKPDEYVALLDYSIRHTAGRMKVIVGVGGNDTALCCRRAKLAEELGADGVLMTAPYYNKTTPSGLEKHFLRAADASGLPLILYNVPSRTAISIPLAVYRTLAAHPNVNGVKEASGDFSLIASISAECPDSLYLWSGNDDHTLPMAALGARGVISVASNLEPNAVAMLCALCQRGDFPAARRIYAHYAELMRLLFCETNPIPVKAAMAMRGMDSGILRLPLVPLSEARRAALADCLARCGQFSG